MNLEALWRVDLINSGASPRKIRLYGRATESRSGRWIADGLSIAFSVRPGFSTVVPADISPIDYNADPSYNEFVTRTGRVQSGEYTICVYAIDEATKDTLGRDCISKHVVLNVTPPRLIYPSNNSMLREPFPLFNWSPVTPVSSDIDVSYKIRIAEIVGQQSPFDALESNPDWFKEEEVRATIFPYPLSAQPFDRATTYAWQVIAYARDEMGGDAEIARSEIGAFTFGAHRDSLISDGDSVSDTQVHQISKNEHASGGDHPVGSEVTNTPPRESSELSTAVDEIPTPEIIWAPKEADGKAAPKKSDTASRPNYMFGALSRKLDAGYYDAVGYLRFRYFNDYGPSKITCHIYDGASRDVTPSEMVLKTVSGWNYYSIDLRKSPRLHPGIVYRLDVSAEENLHTQCRFMIRRCDKCPDDPAERKPK